MSDCSTHAYDMQLKSCPFCGGEAQLVNDYSSEKGMSYQIWHECTGYEGRSGGYGQGVKPFFETPWYSTDAEAIAAWNTRAERTCKFVSSKGSDYPPVCSACGYELGIYDCEWFEDGTYGYGGNYCPNCGARVVE